MGASDDAILHADSGTWHHGLIARWWAEFTEAEPDEIAYFRNALRTSGEPVLDLGCGTGRILLPLLADGVDIDGSDISADMIAMTAAKVTKAGLTCRLSVEPMHELDLGRIYRTIIMCGSFGIGGRRDHDRHTLPRAHRHLEPGGTLLIANHYLPYAEEEESRWQRWLPGHRESGPGEWQTEGERRKFADGDEVEWLGRRSDLDPLEQRLTLHARIRLWHGGEVVKEETYQLHESLYFVQEPLLMLDEAGFRDVRVEGGYSGRPATGDDRMVVYVARK
ncbi:MAG TPA: class I SAM-dependent methyltransferase [Candidatus Dormibacteraeota bacterium]|nr:class I SAM-dependent methyltransferase [Candidatus Dormibacteraeota bacterium]